MMGRTSSEVKVLCLHLHTSSDASVPSKLLRSTVVICACFALLAAGILLYVFTHYTCLPFVPPCWFGERGRGTHRNFLRTIGAEGAGNEMK